MKTKTFVIGIVVGIALIFSLGLTRSLLEVQVSAFHSAIAIDDDGINDTIYLSITNIKTGETSLHRIEEDSFRVHRVLKTLKYKPTQKFSW